MKEGRVVKGIKFVDLVDAGDPVELARRYEERGADELVFLDITATVEGRRATRDAIAAVAAELTIPFAVGGGVATTADVRTLLRSGCDKVSINSAAIRNPAILNEAASAFGAQCVVIAIDAKRVAGGWEVVIDGGRTPTGHDAVAWALEATTRGAGEILLTSIDADGTKAGYDLALCSAVREATGVPLIASGGAGSVDHFHDVFTIAHADAALAASLFHSGTLDIAALKAELIERGVAMRPFVEPAAYAHP